MMRCQSYPTRRHTLVLCERDWGAQEIRKLNVGFKVLSAAEIIDAYWLKSVEGKSRNTKHWKFPFVI